MRDWRGTTVHRDALTVPCRDCNAPAGEPCVVRDRRGRVEKPLEAFPAHPKRINDARSATGPAQDQHTATNTPQESQ